MSERSGEDTGGGGLPWASVFDPVANARALEQIQRRGLQAAGELVDRLVSVVDGARERDPASNGDDATARSAASNGSDLLGVWADLVTRTLQAMARLSVPDAGAREQPTGGPVWVDVVSGRGSGALALVVEQVAGAATASSGVAAPAAAGELWLHNTSQYAVGPLRLHVGELRSPEGATLPSGAIRLDPGSVADLPARSSRGVRASLGERCPGPLPAGRYRGLLQADGAAGVAVAVELTVAEPA